MRILLKNTDFCDVNISFTIVSQSSENAVKSTFPDALITEQQSPLLVELVDH